MQGEASTRLGFTDYFRVELAWAKLLGAVLLLAPRALFHANVWTHTYNQVYAVTKDGQRFLLFQRDATEVQRRGPADRRPQLAGGESTGSVALEAGPIGFEAPLRDLTDEPVAEIVQCGEPLPEIDTSGAPASDCEFCGQAGRCGMPGRVW